MTDDILIFLRTRSLHRMWNLKIYFCTVGRIAANVSLDTSSTGIQYLVCSSFTIIYSYYRNKS
jgi:hypothetical protein